MTRCTFCRRRSAYDYEDIRLCIPCGLAYREGHTRGVIDEVIRRKEEQESE